MFSRGPSIGAGGNGLLCMGLFSIFHRRGCGVEAERMTPQQNRHAGNGSIAVAPEKSPVAKSRGSGLSRAVQPAAPLTICVNSFTFCSVLPRLRGAFLGGAFLGCRERGVGCCGGRQGALLTTAFLADGKSLWSERLGCWNRPRPDAREMALAV